MKRVGIVGAGGMGNVHARQYRKRSDIELFFFDHRPPRAEAFGAAWDIPSSPTLEDLLAKVDIVDICVPTPSHMDTGLKCIGSGKAVLIEKPIALTLADGIKLAEAADKAGTPFMPAHVVRYFPEFARAKGLVEAGRIGSPAAARVRRGGGAPSGNDGWFMDHSKSGGILVDLSIHDFDWLRWTIGEVKHLYSRTVAAKLGRGPDYALTTLTFQNGCVAHVEGTWMDPGGFRTHFEIAGSKGLLQHDSRSDVAVRTTLPPSPTAGAPLPNLEGAMTGLEDPYYLEIAGFLNAVENKTAPPITALDGLKALAIAEAANESAKTDNVRTPATQF